MVSSIRLERRQGCPVAACAMAALIDATDRKARDRTIGCGSLSNCATGSRNRGSPVSPITQAAVARKTGAG